MKKVLIVLLCSLFSLASAQKGVQFPDIKGTSLEDKQVSVPVKNDKYSVIAIAFHRQAEDDLKKWLNPLYDAFIPGETNSKGIDMADVYDVNFMFIPVIAGFKRVADEFKKDTDKRFWQYIMDTEKTDMKLLQDKIKVADNKMPYFFVLDPSGKIIEMQSGPFSKVKLEKLENAIQ